MKLNKYCIVVTGLPASGKSTMGIEVAKLLDIPYFDKDDYLENLFTKRGVGNPDWRQSLSREADVEFREDSIAENEVVLISHWRPKGLNVQFGTPTEWISDHFEKVIELYCDCPVELAATRFRSRVRHEGHVDESRSIGEVINWLKGYEKYLPMNLGQKVVIDSTESIGIQIAKDKITAVIRSNA